MVLKKPTLVKTLVQNNNNAEHGMIHASFAYVLNKRGDNSARKTYLVFQI